MTPATPSVASVDCGGIAPVVVCVPGVPVPQPRPKVRVIGHGKSARGHAYVPKTHAVHAWRNAVAAAARRAFAGLGRLGEKLDGNVRADMLLVLPRPQSLNRKKDPAGLDWCPRRPDLDNLVKAIKDALGEGVLDGKGQCVADGVLVDDARVISGEPLKCIAEKGGQPRVEIILSIETRTPEDAWAAIRRRAGLDADEPTTHQGALPLG